VRKAIIFLSVLSATCLGIVGCGGGSKTTTSTSNPVPVVLTIQDQAPAGLTTLSFGIQITGVSLQNSGGGSDVSLLSSPVTVNLSNLQTLSSLLANTTAPAGTYSGMTITFASPQVSVINNTTGTLTDGGSGSCPVSTTAACSLAPALTASSVMITSAPFPLTLTTGTPVQIALDFNSADSLVNTSQVLSINPMVTVTTNTTPNATTNNLADFTNATGQVTSASNNQVVVTDLSTGQSLTLATTANTTYNGFNTSSTCTTANTFGCVQAGQNVNFNFGIPTSAGAGPTLTSINLNNGVTNGVTGTVISTNPLEVVVTSESPAFSSSASGVAVGQVVMVSPSTGATFSAQTDGATLPAGLTFSAANNLVVGQSLLLDSTGFTAGSGTTPGTIATDNLTLVPSQFGGTINTLNSSDQSFDLNGLNGEFTGNGVTDVTVDTGANTTFTGSTTNNFTGLAAGNTVNVGGLLFNSPTEGGAPVLVGGQVGVTGTTAAAAALRSH
jgi:Domain of unknown function (DUF4382)